MLRRLLRPSHRLPRRQNRWFRLILRRVFPNGEPLWSQAANREKNPRYSGESFRDLLRRTIADDARGIRYLDGPFAGSSWPGRIVENSKSMTQKRPSVWR